MKVRLLSSVLVLCLAVIASACGGDGGGADENTDEPIVIGFTIALTGPNSGFDLPSYNGAKIAVDDMNAEGGVCNRKLQLIANDYASDLSNVVPAARRIIQRKAHVVVPSNDYGFGGPAARVANAQNIFTISEAGDPRYGKQGVGPLASNSFTTTPTEGATMAEFAWSKGWRRPYLLTDTSIDYSKTIADYFKIRWRELGGSIAGEDSWLNSDPSVAAQIARLRGAISRVDVVVLSSYPPGASTAVRQLRGGGVSTTILGNSGYDSVAWLPSVPNLSNFWMLSYGSIQGDDPFPGRTEFGRKYRERFGVPGTDYSPILGYSEIQIIAAAIEAADCSTDGKQMAEALERLDSVDTLSGPVSYTTKCHTPFRDYYVAEVRSGKRILHDPFKVEKIPQAPC